LTSTRPTSAAPCGRIRDEWTAATEEKAWKHFHAGQHEGVNFSDRRRDSTWVELSGGREGDSISDRDQLAIRTYNSDGVCDERVIGFEDIP
jgi:hypothetical protein